MATVVNPKSLIIETSTKVGLVAVAEGPKVLGIRKIEEARRHARDSAPAVHALLQEAGWKPKDIHAVLVSTGPGSYTGLRVGIMSAKTFAYATGCKLIGVESFRAIAAQVPADIESVDVFADAQQDRVYVQRFGKAREEGTREAETTLKIRNFTEWLADENKPAGVTGPGLRGKETRLPPDTILIDSVLWQIAAETLLHLGLQRYTRGETADVWSLEPLYLRPSAAEQQWVDRSSNANAN